MEPKLGQGLLAYRNNNGCEIKSYGVKENWKLGGFGQQESLLMLGRHKLIIRGIYHC